MITNRLAVVMAEETVNITELSRRTGIPRATLSLIYHKHTKGIQFETLDKICEALGRDVGEIFSYKPGNTVKGS